MIKEPRLRFTEEERADPALEKPIRKAEKAAAKADKAQAKIPKKQVKRAEVDPKTGKVTTKLVLEDMPSELGPGQWKGIHPGNCKSQRDTSNRAVSHFGCHQCLQPNWRGWSKHL